MNIAQTAVTFAKERQTIMNRVSGKVALITGAASGIGRATALLFAREGANVAVTDRDEIGAQRCAAEIMAQAGNVAAFALDVTQEHEWQIVFAQIINQWGKLDVLINNAGISFAKPVEATTLEEWRKVMAVNLDGVFLGAKHAVKAMRAGHGGSIINVASASGLKASAGASAYCTSKAAVRMLTKTVALECAQAGDNIRVNTVFPSGVLTPMWESMEFWQELKNKAGGAEGAWQTLAQSVPLKRFASPEEIAEAILYLASDAARFITGADFVIDGGYTAA